MISFAYEVRRCLYYHAISKMHSVDGFGIRGVPELVVQTVSVGQEFKNRRILQKQVTFTKKYEFRIWEISGSGHLKLSRAISSTLFWRRKIPDLYKPFLKIYLSKIITRHVIDNSKMIQFYRHR